MNSDRLKDDFLLENLHASAASGSIADSVRME